MVDTPSVPHNRHAEEAVVGSVLINPEIYYELARIITPNDFYIHRNKWIWDAYVEMTNKRTAIDLLTTVAELERKNQLEEMGGAAYLTAVINQVPSSLNAIDYAEIVRELSERRSAIKLANEIAQKAYDETEEFVLSEVVLPAIIGTQRSNNRLNTREASEKMLSLMENPFFCSTGIIDIDSKIRGLFPEELSILAGYQGTGKSAAKLQGARHNADLGKRVLLIDLEMTAAQTWFRMSCGDLGVDVNSVRSNSVGPETKGKIMNYAAELAEKYFEKIVIYQAPMTPADILCAAMLERPDILYIDTLKNLSGKPHKETWQGWYDFALNFFRINIAQRLGIHVQVLHHINRSTFRENRKPSMHDLMFAGESDADAIFILYRKPEDYTVIIDKGVREIVPISWIVDKSRFGWTGEEEINYKLTTQQFYGMTPGWINRKDIE